MQVRARPSQSADGKGTGTRPARARTVQGPGKASKMADQREIIGKQERGPYEDEARQARWQTVCEQDQTRGRADRTVAGLGKKPG